MSGTDSFASQLAALLQDYTEDVTTVTKQAVDDTADAVNTEIQKHANPKWGKYLRAFEIKTTYDDRFEKRNTWHVKAPHYRLTHLLEKGHDYVGRDGKRKNGVAKPIPHIQYGQEIAEKMLEQKIAEGIEKL